MNKIFISLVLSLLIFLGSAGSLLVKAQDIPVGRYVGSYYSGRNFDNLVFTRTDDDVNFNFGKTGPDPKIGRYNYSIRWQGKFNFDNWLYEFTAITDDGIRVFLDGNVIIDQWHDAAYITYKVQKQVSSGQHTITIEYYQGNGGAAVKLYWVKVIPSPAVSQSPKSPQVTQTNQANQNPQYSDLYTSSCVELASQPVEGTTPLTVQFTGAGYDPYGAIKLYRFNFTDNSNNQPGIVEGEDYTVEHVFNNPGIYNVTLQVQDSKGNWKTADQCKETITVTGSGVGGANVLNDVSPTPTATPSSLPKTGISEEVFIPSIILLALSAFGFFLIKRFKEV